MADQHEDENYALSLIELNNAIVESMTKDCKVDACIDKYLAQTAKANADKPRHPDPNPKKDKEPVDDPQQELLKNQLFADLDDLVPEFGKEVFPENASTADKIMVLEDRINKRYDQWLTLGTPSWDINLHRELLNAVPLPECEPEDIGQDGSENDDLEASSKPEPALHLQELKSVIETDQSQAVFACGGSIEVTNREEGCDMLRHSLPVTLHWSSEDGSLHKTILPENVRHPELSPFQQLVRDCTPATFGLGHEDVLDTSYRHAGKLDVDRFSTTFHPADFGILESIEQTLLPSISSSQENNLEFRRVKADLYKLNVYSGPSGLFRAHVDTPRSQHQFGSLVVCLPSSHQGGALIVRHQGASQEFAWDRQCCSHIQWAAFYSDCEHEIERVTGGHRVTLTYNLFVTEPIGGGLLPRPLVDPHSLPVHTFMKSLLCQPEFMEKGGILGFFCCHYYPHTSNEAKLLLPRKLKGSDMALYASLSALGLWTRVLPVLDDGFEGEQAFIEFKEMRRLERFRQERYATSSTSQSEFGQIKKEPLELSYFHLLLSNDHIQDIHERWKWLYKSRVPRGTTWENVEIVGTELHPKAVNNFDPDASFGEVINQDWPSVWLTGITWVNQRNEENQEEALTRMVYGNESSISISYSNAAIFAIIPPWDQRKNEDQ